MVAWLYSLSEEQNIWFQESADLFQDLKYRQVDISQICDPIVT